MNNINNKSFEDFLDVVFNDMKNIKNDKDAKRMINLNSNKDILKFTKMFLTYPELYDNFKNGKWDHKVPGKRLTESYYHNFDRNYKGEPAAIFGFKLPNDSEHTYDHDTLGNISYGYIMKANGLNDLETRGAAITDDILQSIKSKKSDTKDDPMVKLGIDLYEKYGDKLTKEDLRRTILENKDILRRYKNAELTDRRYQTKGGETVENIAKKYDVTPESIIRKNQKEGLALNKEQSLLPNIKTLLPNPDERFKMSQTPLKRKSLLPQQTPLPRTPEQEEKVRNIVFKITEHDDKRTDVLYKQPQDLTENEARSAMQLARYESNDIELNNRLEQKAKSYYESLYGNKNLERDATGRQINPKPQYTPLTEPKELRTKDNILMREAYQSIAERTAQTGVKSLQRGLNSFPYQTPLKEDDDLGPKTTSRLKENLVTHGLDKTQESIKEDVAAREEA